MSKADRAKKRQTKRHAKPSMPRIIGANDNMAFANDNAPPAELNGVKLSDTQAMRFMAAEMKLASSNYDQRCDGERMMRALEKELEDRKTDQSVRAGLSELRGLEALRGLEISTSTHEKAKGAPRASRDGLETLLTSNTIDRTLHAAGLRYRADFELLDPEKGLTPPDLNPHNRGKVIRGGEGFADKRRQREEFMRDLEAMIQEEDPTFRGSLGRTDIERLGRAVWVLREVAGKGHNLRSLSNSGSMITKLSEALIVGLECAAIAYGLA